MRLIRHSRHNRHYKKRGGYAVATSTTSHGNRRRDTAAIARRSLPTVSIFATANKPRWRSTRVPYQNLYEIEDGRNYTFRNSSFPRNVYGSFAGYSVPATVPGIHNNKRPSSYPSPILRFNDASRTIVCLRRKRRQEVLFAKGIGGSTTSKPKYTGFKHIRC